MGAHILPEFGGGGLGRMLIQSVAKDLSRRGVKAIEAFGDAKWSGPLAWYRRLPAGPSASRRYSRTTAIRGCGWS
jgi:hypothetical protein